MTISDGALISATKAAACLGVHARTVARNMSTIRIGRRVLVRTSDVEAKLKEGRSDAV